MIVPVYNAEKYLRKCLDSIVNQTYKNLEIILVDDGSTDSSGLICDEYAGKDKRIHVVHQPNKGLSTARNVGIKTATLSYITFVDSDDYIELDTYEVVAKSIREYDPDLVFFREKTVDLEGRTVFINGDAPTGKVLFKDRCFAEDRIIGQMINGMCDKVYRAEILRSIEFETGRIHGEDYLFNLKALIHVERVVYIDQIKYSYVTNPQSITRRSFTPAVFDQIYFKDEVFKIAKEHFPDYAALCEKRAFLSRLHTCRPLYSEHLDKQYKVEINEIKYYLQRNRSEVDLNQFETLEYWSLMKSKPLYMALILLLRLRKH